MTLSLVVTSALRPKQSTLPVLTGLRSSAQRALAGVQGRNGPARVPCLVPSLRRRARWALPDLPAPAALATEGRGRQVMCQAGFWVVRGIFSVRKPNRICRSQRKMPSASLVSHNLFLLCPASYVPHQGFIVPFQSDVLISHSPAVAPLISLSRAAALTYVSPALASWSETLAR